MPVYKGSDATAWGDGLAFIGVDMSRYWSKLVNELTPYVPGEQPKLNNLVKLNTNECAYDPSPRVMEAVAAIPASRLKRYPDPESSELKKAFATLNDLQPEQVFLGNGSDEVLAHAFQALLSQARSKSDLRGPDRNGRIQRRQRRDCPTGSQSQRGKTY